MRGNTLLPILLLYGLAAPISALAETDLLSAHGSSYIDPLWRSIGIGQGWSWDLPDQPLLASQSLPLAMRDTLPLRSYVFILDPGHGGPDAGARYRVEGTRVSESQLTLGLCLHLQDSLVTLGARVVLTVAIPATVSWRMIGSSLIPDSGAVKFNLPGAPAITKGRIGLAHRLQVVDLVRQSFPGEEPIWISIHFNAAPGRHGRPEVRGAQFIYPAKGPVPPLARELANVFAGVQALLPHRYYPLAPSGFGHGVKNLFVLRRNSTFVSTIGWIRNDSACSVLCELLNPRNPHDRRRLTEPGSLTHLASLVTRAIRNTYAGQ